MHTARSAAVVGLALALLFASGRGHAQTGIATGTLRGIVADVSGAPLPGAAIQAVNAETGFRRTQVSDEKGRFRIPLLPPGVYTARAELDGFAPAEQGGIRVQVGEAPLIHLRLEVHTVADRLVVTDETPLIETTRTSITDTIDSLTIESLPLNGRDFKELMRLAPQVGEALGRPVVGGAEGMMNSYNVDGADANSLFFGEQLGGALPPFAYSQAAIREFQLLRSSYSARFGGAAGGIVNAVTRSGSNRLQGGAFLYFQDDGMVGTDALGIEQDDFERRQIGLYLGGPLRRDQLHFFVAYDSQRRDQNTVRQPVGLAPELEAAFDDRLASLGIDHATEFDYVVTNDIDVLLLRLDWSPTERHRLWLRNNWSAQGGDNTTFAFLTSGRSNLGREENTVNSAAGSLASVLGPAAFNEAIVQYSVADRPREPNFTAVPQTIIGNYGAVIGQGFLLPSATGEDRLQLQDNLTLLRGDHTLRLGLDYSYLEFDNSFLFSRDGLYWLPSWDVFLDEAPCAVFSPAQGYPCFYTQAFSPIDGLASFGTHLVSAYAADEWRVAPDLTVEFGLRVEHQENPSTRNPNPLEPRTAHIPDDTNLGPRVGFAWDVAGDGRSVLRGGAGVFYNLSPSLLVSNAILGNGVNGFSLTLSQFSPDFPGYPNRLAPEAAEPGGPPSDIFLFEPDFENPETYRVALAYERTLGRDLSLGAELSYAASRHRPRQADVNLDPTPIGLLPDGRPIYGGAAARLDPDFRQKVQITSDGEAEYASLVLSALKRYRDDWTLRAHYTYSENRDHDSFETEAILTFPEDPYNLGWDWGWSSNDVRHRVVVSGTWTAPLGFILSFLGRYRGALPLSPLLDFDANNDGFLSDRPGPDADLGLDGHLPRNSFRGSSAAWVDLRLAKTFRVGAGHEIEAMVEIFNATDEATYLAFDTNFVIAGRPNPAFGEPIQAALARALQLGLRYRF